MISEFYKDCDIFITGGSGIVGKSAVEKLLRSCDVRRIFILLRPKKNLTAEQRLEKLKCSKVFRVLKSQKPNELDKLVAIPGDAVSPNLGITPEYAKVMEDVSIVLHCAATVRFNEPLYAALRLNVGGTWEALKFAETLKKLKIFVHVSTFYSNPYLQHVEPKLYPAPMDWKVCLDMIQDESKHDILDMLTRKITVGFPNTYCFTKNLAENVANSFRDRVPVAIYRPSIVLFAINEPEPGFPPALTGAMGVMVLVAAGVLKTVYIRKDMQLDLTPLDMGTNVMLTFPILAEKKYREGTVRDIPITMFSTYRDINVSLERMSNISMKAGVFHKYVFNKSFLIPGCVFTTSRLLYKTIYLTHQVLPAMLVDGLLRLAGRKPVLLGVMRTIYNSLEVMQPFMFNVYTSDGITNTDELYPMMKGTDFEFEDDYAKAKTVEAIKTNFGKALAMVREVIMREDPSTQERARKVLKAKIIAYNIIRGIVFYYLVCWFYRWLQNYF